MDSIPARQLVKGAVLLAQAQVRDDAEAFVATWNANIAEHGILFAHALAALPTLMVEQLAAKVGLGLDCDTFYGEALRDLSAPDN